MSSGLEEDNFMTDQTQKIALVTGATRGIGKAIAIKLAEQGFVVVGTATSQAGADSVTQYLHAMHAKGTGHVLDVCSDDSVQQLYQYISDNFGTVDVLVNNAAITQDNLLLRMKAEQWDSVIDTNLNSVFRLTKACIRNMLKKNWGRVVTITSVVGVSGNPGQANYCAAKAGVIGFTKSLAQEMSAKGITFNTVAPGFIQTDMTDALTDQQKEAVLSQIPMKQMGAPVDIANTVAFLVSDQANYITGQTIHVNGGMFMV